MIVNPEQSATAVAIALVPDANGASSNTPIGPFQSTIARVGDRVGEDRRGLGTDVEPLPPVGDAARADDARRRGLGHLLRDHDVDRHLHPPGLEERAQSSTRSGSTSESPTP